MMSKVKIGEIDLELAKDIKKSGKESLNTLFTYSQKDVRDLTVVQDVRKGTKVRLTIEKT